jgi:hypothetical protein
MLGLAVLQRQRQRLLKKRSDGADAADHQMGRRSLKRCAAPIRAVHALRYKGRDLDVSKLGRFQHGFRTLPGRPRSLMRRPSLPSEPSGINIVRI